MFHPINSFARRSDTSIKLALPKSAQENICPFVIELSDELCKLMREFR